MQGCRQSFAHQGVVVVDVAETEEGPYKLITDPKIVPSAVNELIYYPTAWSWRLDASQEIQDLVSQVSRCDFVSKN